MLTGPDRWLTGPVCRTLAGARCRVRAMGLGRCWRLCYALGLGDLDDLAHELWRRNRKTKIGDTLCQDKPCPFH